MTHAEIYRAAKQLERIAHRITQRHINKKGDRFVLEHDRRPPESTLHRDRDDLNNIRETCDNLESTLWN